jgi:hypothetical protein
MVNQKKSLRKMVEGKDGGHQLCFFKQKKTAYKAVFFQT